MSALQGRLAKLEAQLLKNRNGGCLACALSKMGQAPVTADEWKCDGLHCHLGLADLLSLTGADYAPGGRYARGS